MTVGWAAPLDLGGAEGRELARAELADPLYAAARPPWWQRVTEWLWDRITATLDDIAGAAGGAVWVFVLVAVIVLVAVVVARRVGLVGRRHSRAGTVFEADVRTASDHRFAAARAAERADWDTATVESFRALIRALEERGALDTRPGSTADEAARAAADVFPLHSQALAVAAGVFDEVAYGGRPGTPEGHRQLSTLDATLQRSTFASTTMALAEAAP